MGILKGRVGIITGGASGIGRATAWRVAAEDATVVVADIDVEHGEATAQALKDAGTDSLFVRTDVTRPGDVSALIGTTLETFGRLDWAVNSAGVEGAFMPTADYSPAEWDRVLHVNLRGVFLSMKEEIPVMISGGGGAIVNIASTLGLGGFPNRPASVAANHGVVGLTKAAALEYGTSGVRINALCPGVIRTPMLDGVLCDMPEMESKLVALHPIGRLGQEAEVAGAALWLLADESSFVTGTAVPVDGGWRAQ